MTKCRNCGGDTTALGNNTYRCKYCGHTFQEQEYVSRRVETMNTSNRVKTINTSNEGVDVFEKNKNGVLEITCTFREGSAAGSGLLIDGSGYALTNTHVVTNNAKPCNDISVKIAGQRIDATIVKLGDDNGGSGNGVDLALIKLDYVPANATVIKMGNFDSVRIGEQVFVIGNSLGDGTCMTSGIVSDKRRVVNGKTLMMTDCAINGGNSGGPIFNRFGDAIGVIVASRIKSDGTATEGMNYAIPMDIVQQFLDDGTPIAQRAVGAFSLPKDPKIDRENREKAEKFFGKSLGKPGRVKSIAPCPRCKSKEHTFIENGIFVCDNCGFVEGDKP